MCLRLFVTGGEAGWGSHGILLQQGGQVCFQDFGFSTVLSGSARGLEYTQGSNFGLGYSLSETYDCSHPSEDLIQGVNHKAPLVRSPVSLWGLNPVL